MNPFPAELDFRPDIQGKGRVRALADLASRQHGVVARRQLRDLGFGHGAIDNQLREGRLHPVHRAVFSVGHARLTWRGQFMAAVLACGKAATLSHWSAAGLHRLVELKQAHRAIDVTVARRRTRRGREGIRLHYSDLSPDELTVRAGVPVTTVARTICDLAAVADLRLLHRAVDQAERLGLLDVSDLTRLCARRAGRRGIRSVRMVLDVHDSDVARTRSNLEALFIRTCRRHRLPVPELNQRVLGHEVDALWREQRVIVELDGYEYHRTRAAFERDRERDERLQQAGYIVQRVTWRRLESSSASFAASVDSLLRQRTRH